jgi:hypothetical protein
MIRIYVPMTLGRSNRPNLEWRSGIVCISIFADFNLVDLSRLSIVVSIHCDDRIWSGQEAVRNRLPDFPEASAFRTSLIGSRVFSVIVHRIGASDSNLLPSPISFIAEVIIRKVRSDVATLKCVWISH